MSGSTQEGLTLELARMRPMWRRFERTTRSSGQNFKTNAYLCVPSTSLSKIVFGRSWNPSWSLIWLTRLDIQLILTPRRPGDALLILVLRLFRLIPRLQMIWTANPLTYRLFQQPWYAIFFSDDLWRLWMLVVFRLVIPQPTLIKCC